jgi:hypothetical protein
MAIRKIYSSLDMVRMAKFAKENPNLKPIPLIKSYNDKYPEVTEEQKLKNIRNWLDDNEIMEIVESSNCETTKEYPCHGCQGGGCPLCNGYGTLKN